MTFLQTLTVMFFAAAFHSVYTAHVPEIRKLGVAYSIAHQEEMEEKLTEKFNSLFHNFIRESSLSSATFMYVCDEDCVHSAVYEFGLSSAFLLALLSDRTFSIFPRKDSPFYSFYEENSYPWKIDEEFVKNRTKRPIIPPSGYHPKFYADLLVFEKQLSFKDFNLEFKHDIIYLNGNFDWILDLRRNPSTPKKIPWLFYTHASDFIRLLHNGLFRLKQPIRHVINNELIEKVGQNKLLCLSTNRDQKHQIRFFLDRFLEKYSDNYTFYLTGFDNLIEDDHTQNISNKMANIDFRKMFKVISNHTGIHDPARLQKLLDVHILKFCDVLIVSENPSAYIAAHLRRKEDDLYCFKNEVIYPCNRRLIARSFRDTEQKPSHLDIKYYCKIVENCGVEFH